ncbi:MAG TPA: hypothetical protein VFI42_06410 [Thermomicrobiaceae bacterium]|nr:hypothetical protein [Thermomicrobiaceae bacterium]
MAVRGEWNEPVTIPGRGERAREGCLQFCCSCLAVAALVIVAGSFIFFIFGMTSVVAHSWEILSHWLLLK